MSRHRLLPNQPHRPRAVSYFAPILGLLVIVSTLFLPVLRQEPILAQSETQTWTAPENLSNSGAASQPRVLSGPGEILQAFWMDRFDGLMTSIFDGSEWSAPHLAPLFTDSTLSSYLTQMPFLIADRSGWLHAFWQSSAQRPLNSGQNFTANSLYHSKMPAGGIAWTTPELLAEDALTYAVFAPVDSGLTLAYVRRIQTESTPSGVYFRRLPIGGSSWEPSLNVFASIYYRLLTPGSTNIATADDSAGNLFIIWFDPDLNLTLSTQSIDNGVTWSEPSIFSDPQAGDTTPTSLRLTAMPGISVSIWQTLSLNNCSLYQQEWVGPSEADPSAEAAPTATPETAPTATPEVAVTTTPGTPTGSSDQESAAPSNWSAAEQIFPNLVNCPNGDSLWPGSEQEQIYWLWGQGSSSLSLSAWDNSTRQWSIPFNQTFSFENPRGVGMIVLGDLHATLSGDRMAVVGYDATGEIWAVRSEQSLPDFVYAPQPAWGASQVISSGDTSVSGFALGMDQTGRTHIVYSGSTTIASNRDNSLGASLNYTTIIENSTDQQGISQASSNQPPNTSIEIFPGNPVEINRQPGIFVDDASGFLHLVWSGGEQGDILYSRAPLEKAASPGEWFPAQTISGANFASWPQIGMDSTGRLFVLYSISLNENRGIYLAVSDDQGQTWSIAEKIFDAAAAGLQGVEKPALYVEPNGTLHAAWVETSPAGSGVAQGVFYTSSSDAGKTWLDPVILAGQGNDWPELIAAANLLHLIYVQSDCSDCTQLQTGQLWERTLPLQKPATGANSLDTANRWSTSVRLPGWREISLPFGAASDGGQTGGSLYLSGIDPQNGSITLSTWSDGAWSAPETFSPRSTINMETRIGMGLQAATKPEGGSLAVAWLASPISPGGQSEDLQPELLLNFRRINSVEIPAQPTALPTPTATPQPAPTATIFVPTPTPDLNIVPPPNSTAQSPLILSAAVVGLFVAGFFVWRLARSRRK